MIRYLLAVFFFGMAAISPTYAEQKISPEQYAYETYLSCFNQHWLLYDNDKYSSDLTLTLFQCADFATYNLERSKSTMALRYLAYLQLLNTDGAAAADQEYTVKRKGLGIKPYLLEVRKRAGDADCIAPGTKLNEKLAPNLCSRKEDQIKWIDGLIETLNKQASKCAGSSGQVKQVQK